MLAGTRGAVSIGAFDMVGGDHLDAGAVAADEGGQVIAWPAGGVTEIEFARRCKRLRSTCSIPRRRMVRGEGGDRGGCPRRGLAAGEAGLSGRSSMAGAGARPGRR